MTPTNPPSIRRVEGVSGADLAALTDVLRDCVHGGASVGFLAPLDHRRASDYWGGVADEVAAGRRILLVADDELGPVGTIQVVPATFENQPHRADVVKLLVHRRARGRGLGAALVGAAEAVASAHGFTLLVLDTVPGSDAERLYRRLGWRAVGSVPGYALMPDGSASATTFYYRQLATVDDG